MTLEEFAKENNISCDTCSKWGICGIDEDRDLKGAWNGCPRPRGRMYFIEGFFCGEHEFKLKDYND